MANEARHVLMRIASMNMSKLEPAAGKLASCLASPHPLHISHPPPQRLRRASQSLFRYRRGADVGRPLAVGAGLGVGVGLGVVVGVGVGVSVAVGVGDAGG